ncbi:MAG: glycosyltransferase family 4 protein [Phycisphaerales bacterium]|nr:glycosyltransferase family 4 protein [Phycisphaerales bacterium]
MKYAYYNDRPLSGQRTGVGHYLDLVCAYWPTDRAIELRGLGESVTRRKSAQTGLFVFPSLEGLARLELEPVSAMRPPKDTGLTRLKTTIGRRGYERAINRLAWLASKRDGFGLVFEPNHLPASGVRPCVATIHDLSVLELPEFHPDHRVQWWRRAMGRAMETVDRFLCVSQSTADAMVRVLGCPQDRLEVIPLASRWGRAPDEWTPALVRRQLGAPERYLLHVGTIEPRKNIVRLLDAYGTWTKAERAQTKLVLCGRAGWGSEGFWSSIIDHPVACEVLATGYASDAQLAGLVRGSLGTLCPSHYEGFGLPTMESMAMGVPTVISCADSLVEITGGTVPVVDTGDTYGWADAMRGLGDSCPGERCERARQRAEGYSWAITARKHHDLMVSIIT